MRKEFLAGVMLVCSVAAHCQVKNRTIKGFLGLQGGESFTYHMVFRDSAGYLQGDTYTWLVAGREVKATFKGEVDKKAKTLSFREIEILYNKGFSSNVTICLIKAQLRYQLKDGQMVLSGQITSNDIGNVYCGVGTITFMDSEDVRDLFKEDQTPAMPASAAPPPPSAKPAKPIRIVYDTARPVRQTPPTPKPATAEPEKITAGQDKYIDWYTDSVVIEVWDNSQVDGDVVTIQMDGQNVLPKYTVAKEKKVLRIPFAKDKAEIRIIAGSEGSYPPNTVDMLLIDGSRTHRIIANNTIGKQAVIKLQKVKNTK